MENGTSVHERTQQLDIELVTTYARVTDDTGTNVSGALPLHLAERRAEMLTRRVPGRTYKTTPTEAPALTSVRRKRVRR